MRICPSISWNATTRVLCIAAGVLISACQPNGDPMLCRNVIEEKRDEAMQRWDAVRGGVRLQLARQHLKADRLDDAEKELKKAIAATPEDSQAFLLMARLRLEQRQLAHARGAITIAVSMPHNDPEIEYFAGIVAQRYGDLHTALEHYAAAAMQAPNVAAYLLAQAETFVALDRPADALELISPRISDFDDNVAVQMLTARIYRMLGLRGPAAEHCREVLRADDADQTLRAEAGQMLVWAKQYADAISMLQPLVEGYLADHRRTSALTLGRTTHAKPLTSAGTESSASVVTPAVAHALARAYLATGHWGEAQWALKPFMAQNHRDTVAWCLYVRAAVGLGDLDAAAEAIETLHRDNEPTAETLLLAAYVAYQRGDDTAALEAAEAALKQDKRLVTAYYFTGRVVPAADQGDRLQR